MTAHDPSLSRSPPRVVAIMGPTAAGKAELGREAARRLSLPVLVCDSVKVYRGLDIGSAKPTAAERVQVRHELLDLVDPDESFSAGDYARLASPFLAEGRGLFVGGTGFYLRAVAFTSSVGVQGQEHAVDDPERRAFEGPWEERERVDPGAVHRALHAIDPEIAGTIHPHNVVRSLRALWLCERTGGPISAVRASDPPRLRFSLMLVVLEPEPEAWHDRMVRRVDRMLAQGFLDEVEKLHRAGYHPRHKAMRSLGYRQLMEVVEGRSTLAHARDEIVAATRQYARRQRTYLRTQLAAALPAASVVTVRTPAHCPWGQIEAFVDASP